MTDKTNTIKIAPSILAADFSCLGKEIAKVEAAGADMIHIDIMDGHFVPNLTFGPPVVAAIRKITKLPFDVHLMVTNPQELINPFIEAGADIITVHVETAPHLHRLIQGIKQRGILAGVALNPATPLTVLTEVLEDVDLVLLMSVNPGFGGQKFIPGTVDKIRRLSSMLKGLGKSIDIEVDGGINQDTAPLATEAGANILVAGSAVYAAADAGQIIKTIRA